MAENSVEIICLDDDDDVQYVEAWKKATVGSPILHPTPGNGTPSYKSCDKSVVTPRVSKKKAEKIKAEVTRMFNKCRMHLDNPDSPVSAIKVQNQISGRENISKNVRKNLFTQFEVEKQPVVLQLSEIYPQTSDVECTASNRKRINETNSARALANEYIPSSHVNVEAGTAQANISVVNPSQTKKPKIADDLKSLPCTTQTGSQAEALPSNSQSAKLSYHVKKHPNKFSLSPQKSVSPLKSSSASPKKKKINTLRRTITKHKDEQTARRRLFYRRSPQSTQKCNIDLEKTDILPPHPRIDEHGYHARYFTTLIRDVIENEKLKILISEEEMDIINSFFKLNNKTKELFVRIYYRKFRWLKVADLRYDMDLDKCIKELEEHGFFTTDLIDANLEELFELLNKKDIETLAKSLNIKCTKMNKDTIWMKIFKYCKSQTHISENLVIVSSENFLKRRIKDLAGPCLKLCLNPRGLFHRLELLFSLMFTKNEDLGSDSANLLTLCYAGTNKVFYPSYKVDTTFPVFRCRADLLKYEEAARKELDVTEAIQLKAWLSAGELLISVRASLIQLITNNEERLAALQRPLCLRYFTAGTAYTNALSKGIDALKNLGETDQAIADLRTLLSQTIYLPYHRGQWYEKLAVILCKNHRLEELSDLLVQGISDECTDEVHKHMLSHRCQKLIKMKKGVSSRVKAKVKNYILPDLRTAPVHVIKAKALDNTKAGFKKVFVQIDTDSQERTYSSVEEVAKSHYKTEGYMKGFHAEGSIIYSLFALLFWDIIYECPVTHVFQSPYQQKPLDLDSGEFYENRKTEIQRRLSEMEKWTEQEVCSWTRHIYETHVGEVSLVRWAWFAKVEDSLEIILSIGWSTLLKICEKIAKTYKTSRRGFPDLILWTPGKKMYKFVEVKGPKDTLSMNQKLWLDFLVGIEASAEVCYVTTVGSCSWTAGATSKEKTME